MVIIAVKTREASSQLLMPLAFGAHAGALLALLVALSMVIWSLTLVGRSRWLLSGLSVLAFGFIAANAGPYVVKAVALQSESSATDRWQPWEPGKVEQVLASGQAVFVDYTAAWCVTCQYNKKTTLANAAVLADFDAKKVHLLRADWTRRDPAITAALSALGRNGVPVYVLYQKGRAPVVRFTLDHETALDIARGAGSAQRAFMAGTLQVSAEMFAANAATWGVSVPACPGSIVESLVAPSRSINAMVSSFIQRSPKRNDRQALPNACSNAANADSTQYDTHD